MKISRILISWFRGAAEPISLELQGKSAVIYGLNGSGKSSFVDAVEFILNDGKVGHLAHEYSGKNQKNALPNTHKPAECESSLSMKLVDGTGPDIQLKEDGSTKSSGSTIIWDYRRTVLRQGEVIDFIQDTKGGKYSALLPLFGLQPLEYAAENLRQLAKNIESLSQVDRIRTDLIQTATLRKTIFGTDSDSTILDNVKIIHKKYLPEAAQPDEETLLFKEANQAIEGKLGQLTADQRRHTILKTVGKLRMANTIEDLRAAMLKLADAADPLIAQKLEVLQPTENLLQKLPEAGTVVCPACGQSIDAANFREHVVTELERLKEIRKTFNEKNRAASSLCDDIKEMKSNLEKEEVKSWRTNIEDEHLNKCLNFLANIKVEALRTKLDSSDLQDIEVNLIPIVESAELAAADAPAEATELLKDKNSIENAKAVLDAKKKQNALLRVEALIKVVQNLEQATRDQIRIRSNAVIAEISSDIKTMWSILHPDEAIEDIHLYLPQDTDKAIDISLKFFGKELSSPRLTLSEGYRNSLGLCIFLAMAKREAPNDLPVILDDVVVSLDRNHRGMIALLLKKEFSARQIVIMTHDRDWYTELRHQLDEKHWLFKTLLPYETPKLGIRWSDKTTTFDDARAEVDSRPDSACNDVRKIMDIELASVAERIYLSLPFRRFDKNDRRTSHEFLEKIISDGKKCFQMKSGTGYIPNEAAIESLKNAYQLLVTWANRGSHTFDATKSEASTLVAACEKALETFKCPTCSRYVWSTESGGSEFVQCQCGGIRWRYGKS